MKTLAALLLSFLLCAPAHAAVALVNHAAAQGATAASSATTTAANFTGTTLLYVCTVGYYGASVPTDSTGANTYTAISAQGSNTSTNYSTCYYSSMPTVTSSMTFTVPATNYYVGIAAIGFSGTASTSPLDQSNAASGASVSSLQPGNVSVVSGEVTVTFTGLDLTSGSTSIDSGFTLVDQIGYGPAGNSFGVAMAYNVAASTPSNPMWAYGGSSSPVQAHIATFKAAGGGGGGCTGPGIYYVSTTGSNANPGTLASPFGTIAKALSVVSAGNTILLRAGTYSGAGQTIDTSVAQFATGTSGNPITISAYPGCLGASTTPGPRAGAEVVTITPTSGNSAAVKLTDPAGSAPSYIIVEDIIFDGVHNTYSEQPGNASCTGNGNVLVYMNGGASFNQFIHLEIKNNGGSGWTDTPHNGNADHNQLLYSTSHDNGLDPCYTNSGYGVYSEGSYDTFTGNLFYNNHGYGMQKRGSNNVINGNQFYNNYVNNAAPALGGCSGGGFNDLSSVDQTGDGGGDSNTIYNNLAYNNGFNSMGVAPTCQGTASGASGILIYSYESNGTVYFNTSYHNNGDGIAFQYYDETTPPIARNNISYANIGTNINDLGGLQGHMVVVQSNNLTANPSFNSPTGTPPNFHLTSSSTNAIGQGVVVSGISTDADGNSRPNPPAIGAYEYQTSPPPSTTPMTLMLLGIR